MNIYPETICIIAIAMLFVLLVYCEKGHVPFVSDLGRGLLRLLGRKRVMPICSCCKRVRTAGGWAGVDRFPRQLVHMQFSYTYCPVCERRDLQEQKGHDY